jgi:hypothetical protein
MKSYTDIEQSKKLAEILPIESADMCWIDRPQIVTDCPEVPVIPDIELKAMLPQNKLLPCWSLAALLNVLPDEISTGEGYQNKYEIDIRRHYGGNNITLYQIAYGNNKGSSGNWHDMINTSEQEKFVDVCYEVIIKLHEMNLL